MIDFPSVFLLPSFCLICGREDDLQNILSDWQRNETVRQLSGESGLSGWARLGWLGCCDIIIYLLSPICYQRKYRKLLGGQRLGLCAISLSNNRNNKTKTQSDKEEKSRHICKVHIVASQVLRTFSAAQTFLTRQSSYQWSIWQNYTALLVSSRQAERRERSPHLIRLAKSLD